MLAIRAFLVYNTDVMKLYIIFIIGVLISAAWGVQIIGAQEEQVLYSGVLGDGLFAPLKGNWEIVQKDEAVILRLDDNFKARRGPDLKVYFSTLPVEDIHDRNAGSASYSRKIGRLKNANGAQEYRLPANLDLSEYKSWIVHCERYSHFWDGADLVADSDEPDEPNEPSEPSDEPSDSTESES